MQHHSINIDIADLPPLPKVGKALLIIDLQKGLSDEAGILPVIDPPTLFNDVGSLVDSLRQSGFGKIIWVMTQYEANRPINGRNAGVDDCEWIITDDEVEVLARDGSTRPAGTRRPTLTSVRANLAKMAAIPGLMDVDVIESLEADDDLMAADTDDAESDVEETDVNMDGARAEFTGAGSTHNEAFLSLHPKERSPQHKRAFTTTKLVDNLEKVARPNQDLYITKSHYSALGPKSPLVHLLRSHFIHELYICGALSNTSVYATAMGAAQNGFNITLVKDCLGYRGKERHEQSLRSLDAATGCNFVTSKDIIDGMGGTKTSSRLGKGPAEVKVSAN